MTTSAVGTATQDKPINLAQLEDELNAGGVAISGLGMADGYVHAYDADGQPTDFASGDQATVDAAIAAHVALRDKTDAEYSAEFQDEGTTPERKQEIRDITAGLLPREQVPMTAEDMQPAGAR